MGLIIPRLQLDPLVGETYGELHDLNLNSRGPTNSSLIEPYDRAQERRWSQSKQNI